MQAHNAAPAAKMRDTPQGLRQLRDNRRHGRAHNTPPEHKNEKRIKRHIHQRRNDHGVHRNMRIPLGTHDVVERETNQVKDIPNKNNIHVLQREPHRLGLHTEEPKHRSANGKTKNRNPRAHDYRKRNR